MVDRQVAAKTTGVDVIVGGHSNTYLSNLSDLAEGPYPTMMGTTAIVQAYAYGKFLGELNLLFDDQGQILSATGEPLIMDAAVKEDAVTKSRIAEAAEPLNEIINRVVADAAGFIDGERSRCHVQECEMGNLITDAMLAEVSSRGVQIAIQNSGGIRASIDQGPVTMGEVLTVLPFQNTLSTFEISGAVLLAALENGVSQIEEVAGRFPQVAGMRYTVDRAAEIGARVSAVQIAGQPLELDRVYRAVSNNYVRNGGDGYKMFRGAQNAYDFGPDLADVLAAFMAAAPDYRSRIEGRITFK